MAASSESTAPILYHGEMGKNTTYRISDLFKLVAEDEDTIDNKLNDLVSNSYGNDLAILGYIVSIESENEIDWNSLLVYAISRQYPGSFWFKKLPNLPIVYHVLKYHSDELTVATYHAILDYFIEHIYGKLLPQFEKYDESIVPSRQFYVQDLKFMGNLCGSHKPKELFEACDKVMEQEPDRQISYVAHLITSCYENDNAILKAIIQYCTSSSNISRFIEAAYSRKLLLGGQFERLPNVPVIKYLMENCHKQISPKSYGYIIDLFLSHITGIEHKDGERI